MDSSPLIHKAPEIKICCIGSISEARSAIAAGASAIGLVSEMPSGPGVIGEELIAEIASSVEPPSRTFLLTSKQTLPEIVAQHTRCATTTLQICDDVGVNVLEQLRVALFDVELVQVVHVCGPESVSAAIEVEPYVDAILLDSGNLSLDVKELGGTGRTHDWNVSRQIVAALQKPVYLAGGLRPENVADAVAAVRPYGIDVCSGVRSNGKLDEVKLRAFVAQARWK